MSIDFEKIPKLGFGFMRLPQKNGKTDISQTCEMVDAYMDHGFNYFDTAYGYLDGMSEIMINETIVKRYPRDSFYLADKLPKWMLKGLEDRDRIFCDQLKKTGVTYFDFYLLHSVEDDSDDDGYVKYDCYEWAKQKKAEGLIHHFGISFHGTPSLLERLLIKHPEIEFVQIQLNYADWKNPIVHSGELYSILRNHNIPIIVMEPVKGGMLAKQPLEIENMMKKARPDSSIASWALRFAASLEGVLIVLSGMSNKEQVMDNIKIFSDLEPICEDERQILDKAVEAMTKMPTIPCTDCRYCVDRDGCPQNIEIPEIFKALNTLRIYGEDMRPHFFYNGLVETNGRASDCIACGHCESVCPQHLSIIELLKEASDKLDRE